MSSHLLVKIFQSRIDKVRIVFLFNILCSILYISYYGLSLSDAGIIYAVFFLMNCLGITITFHRYYSHRSFQFKNSLLENMCLILGSLSCSGSAIGWVGIHRKHHQHSDEKDDPHQASRGLWDMLSLAYDSDFNVRYVKDLIRKQNIMFNHNYYFLIPFIYAVLCFSIFGLWGFVVLFTLPASITLASEGLTNYINHKEHNDYQPVNVWWINLFSFGDGWHKNHHDIPSKYTTKQKWYEVDMSGLVIKTLLRKV